MQGGSRPLSSWHGGAAEVAWVRGAGGIGRRLGRRWARRSATVTLPPFLWTLCDLRWLLVVVLPAGLLLSDLAFDRGQRVRV
jgi:hypothetical protein